MENRKTLIAGASNNPSRYSYKAAHMLKSEGIDFIPVGLKRGEVAGQPILNKWPDTVEKLDTITLYIGPDLQPPLYDNILKLQPRRIIFNPGTENEELVQLARAKGIETEYACTLVLLSTGQY
ncbi:MAG: CoA-binding protein [Flavobacteriales bacterium]|nr:CoA-binding protein [Flavobacteriales bacterium]